MNPEQEQSCARETGPYRDNSKAQKQRFWQLVIEQGCSAYKAAQENYISLKTAYTWKKKLNRQVVFELTAIYEEPKNVAANLFSPKNTKPILKNWFFQTLSAISCHGLVILNKTY